jgi:hypothetical protein
MSTEQHDIISQKIFLYTQLYAYLPVCTVAIPELLEEMLWAVRITLAEGHTKKESLSNREAPAFEGATCLAGRGRPRPIIENTAAFQAPCNCQAAPRDIWWCISASHISPLLQSLLFLLIYISSHHSLYHFRRRYHSEV